jgi:Rod binding domain-containing protein
MSADLLGQGMPSLAALADKVTHCPIIKKVAGDFESILLQRLLEEMRRTIPESGLLESGVSDQVQGLFWFYLAQDVADKGSMGLATELVRQLKWAEGAAPTPSAEEQP